MSNKQKGIEAKKRIEEYKRQKHAMVRDKTDNQNGYLVISYWGKVNTPPDKLQEKAKYKTGWKQKSGLSDKQKIKFGV